MDGKEHGNIVTPCVNFRNKLQVPYSLLNVRAALSPKHALAVWQHITLLQTARPTYARDSLLTAPLRRRRFDGVADTLLT
jgi:hypothetical protein